ncbi:hypothetical protein [Aeromicrobium chenweiae]|uniref:Uncharacterized protein n=1 Tax=Aeromicrobium chenweiae TaxID=2079793 RepID=A0A2S0WL10_9ACTN|nr:hypothetical protein [Aeromicrobium chenweiae]AWB92011.1 hypothetical protein C3E78_07245 [Aeromicrobium chenweiae]TGN32862.1 hypothetical protein E4L97_09220 [Aeromicrobium chenweiae]
MNEHPTDPSAAGPPQSPARRAVIASVLMLALGLAAGLVWLWLADPAEWQVTNRGIVLTESAAQNQFSVVAMFVLVGAVSSLVWGWAVGRRLQDLGWVTTPLVVVVTALAALVAWRVGVALGPADPTTVPRPALGGRIPAQLKVDSVVPVLVWPIFGLLGLVGATWTLRASDGRAARS